MTFGEDSSQIRTRNGPRVMASLRNLAITILRLTEHASIAAALHHHARSQMTVIEITAISAKPASEEVTVIMS